MEGKTLTQKVALNASALAGARAAMAAIGILSVGISTRYLGLAAYGDFVVAQSLVGVISILTDIGMGTLAAREIAKRPDEARRIAGSVLTVGFGLSLAAIAIGTGVVLVLYSGSGDELVRRGALILMLTMPISAPFMVANAWFVSQQRAYIGMFCSVLASVLTVAGLVAVVAFDLGFTGVVGAYLLAAVVQGVLLPALASAEIKLVPNLDLRLGKQLLAWALPLGGAIVLHSLYWRIDMILLSKIASSTEVALYGVAIKVVEAPLMLPNFILLTLMPEFARLIADRQRLREVVQKAFSVMLVAAVGLSAFLIAFAPEITKVIGGEGFERAGEVLQIMAPALLFVFPAALMGQVFFAHNKQKTTFYLTAALLVVNVALNLVLIPLWEARGAALAWGLSEVFLVATFLVLYKRHLDSPPRLEYAVRLLMAGVATAAVGLVRLLPGIEEAGPAVPLAIGAVLCPLVYVVLLYALKAMPREFHANLVEPLWERLKPG